MNAAETLKQAMAVFAIVDPVGCVGIFLALTRNQSEPERKRTAAIATGTMAAVLTLSAFLGERLLWFFGIGIPSFQVGGGILILLMAISMLNASTPAPKRTKEEADEADDRDAVAVVPLAVPLLAGPGAITTVIIQAHASADTPDFAALLGIILSVSAVTWGAFRLAVPIAQKFGRTGMNIVTRLMGLILSAISVEIITAGLKGLFPSLA